MAGRIPQDFIDDLVTRADIVDVISARVPLRKAGREYKACCPFHDEKTPSFTVSPDKGFYHCFGCGAHGTALGFLMEFDRLEFPEAVEELAQMLGLEVPREQSAEAVSPVAPLYAVLDEAARLYQRALRDHPDAVDYLKRRGLDGETVRRFGIGYAPPGWDFLVRRLGKDPTGIRSLRAAGLVTERDGGGHYDRFRDRVMFPIRDARGRVIAFGGRVTGDGEPKYLNSPETPVFHKGRELYGLYEARQANRRLDHVVVVEGYMDVASLARHGVTDVVATLGTATTAEHLRRLFRATQDVVFCFDGDRAGREAAWRALQASLSELRDGRQVRFLFLPDGEDPDSLVRAGGAEAFAARLADAMPLSDYLLAELRRQAPPDTLDGRARLAEFARPLVAELPAGVYRELLLDRLADAVGLDRRRLDAVLRGDAAPRAVRPPPRAPGRGRQTLVRRAIALLLHYPDLGAAQSGVAALGRARQRGVPLLIELLELTARHPELSPAALVERFRGRREGPHLEQLLADEMLLGHDAAARELADCMDRLVASADDQRLEELVAKAGSVGLTDAEREELRGLRRVQHAGEP